MLGSSAIFRSVRRRSTDRLCHLPFELLVRKSIVPRTYLLQPRHVLIHFTLDHTLTPCAGGPGDPGSSFILSLAPYLRAIIGPAYDLVGFDPRGIGFSTPSLSLFPDLAQAAAYLGSYPSDLEAEPDAFARAYVWGQVYSGIAEQKVLAGEKVWESVGTAAVVQDILAIAKAFGSDVVNYWGYS